MLLVAVPARFGLLSPLGLLVTLGAAMSAFAALLYVAPSAAIVLSPALIPIPLVGYIFPYEMMLGVTFVLVVLATSLDEKHGLAEFNRLEFAYLAFLGWALFTGFWCHDGVRYVLGVRRLLGGFVILWTAHRIWRLAPRPVFLFGLVAGAATISLATLAKRISTGYSNEQALMSRGTATDLGWGWANYIAALLIILTPFILHCAFHRRERWLRWSARITFPLVVAVQLIVVARGALLLFAAAVVVQLTAGLDRRRRLWGLLAGLAIVAALLIGPWGQAILMRFTSLRELSSGTIRLWYFREGWHRTLDNLPWGIGLQQGFSYPDKLQGLDPHDYWLDLSAELGVLGPPLWLFFLVMMWRRIRRVARQPGMEGEGLALQIAFVAGQIHTLIEPTFQGTQYMFLYLWMAAACFGYRDEAVRSGSSGTAAAGAAAGAPA